MHTPYPCRCVALVLDSGAAKRTAVGTLNVHRLRRHEGVTFTIDMSIVHVHVHVVLNSVHNN
jgi:hypothetical protein